MMSVKKFIQGIRYPHKSAALPYVFRQPSMLRGLLNRGSDEYYADAVRGFLDESLVHAWRHGLPEQFRRYVASQREVDADGWRMLLYLLVRKYRPKVFIETGVSWGASTAYILAAMRENGEGRLYSIDLPPEKSTPSIDSETGRRRLADGQTFDPLVVGGYVPDYLKDRWELIPGDAKVELPALVKRLGSIDVFFHDSLHTYEHMQFEFKTAWPHLAPGGFVISHDVIWNNAWLEFTREVGARYFVYYSLSMFQKAAVASKR